MRLEKCSAIRYNDKKEMGEIHMQLRTKASYSDQPSQREKENLQVAYQAACEAMVLLKNDGTLPLKTKKIALFGAGASMTIKGGTGSGEVNERHSVTVLEGLKDRGFEIATEDWIHEFEEEYAGAKVAYQKAKRMSIFKPNKIMELMADDFKAPDGPTITKERVQKSGTDSCIYVLSRQAGEGGDRRTEKGDLFLTDGEEAAIRACAELYDHFVLVINCGSSMDMAFAEQIPGINAILYICQLGTEGGHAFADVVSGQVSPSGKLSDTWAKQYADIPFSQEYSYLNGNLKDEYYKEGIYVGYRYFDSFDVEPAYPFGFGLSYTDFDLYSAGVSAEGTTVAVKATVQNRGEQYAGKEVAQLYLSAPNGELHKEFKSLVAFGKTDTLAPGEKQTLTLSFDLKEFASYRERDNSFVLEPGDYILRLGNSSRNTQVIGVLTLGEECVVSKHTAVCPQREPLEELAAKPYPAQEVHPGVPRIDIDPQSVETVIYSYETPGICPDQRVQNFLNALSLEDMAEIVVGSGMFFTKNTFDLPGSVGNTTSKFWDKGLVNVALCDGPAGVRVQKRSGVDKKGNIKPVDLALSFYELLPGFVKSLMCANPEKDTLLYQYCTAFPVANALAQTWNVGLMRQVGTAIYQEMKEYGCTFWLAPAVNIHRNPLCGRNFEYFSEDPFLAGKMASAITAAVQQEEGFYVTVKHFACNNQEDQRNFVSSNLSQRALREIYLRAFERCVREGKAKGIMTSYNHVNGVYAPNSYDLCTKVLRNEWGFDGVVMTDWFSTGGKKADHALCMSAGNDLLMPGGSGEKKAIAAAVKSGKINETDLRRCCANVLKSIFNSATQREYIG